MIYNRRKCIDMRLIDADALIPKGTKVTDEVIAVHNAIAAAQTVDAVPVVRCKDCVMKYILGDEDVVCARTGVDVDPDDFCSYGSIDE